MVPDGSRAHASPLSPNLTSDPVREGLTIHGWEPGHQRFLWAAKEKSWRWRRVDGERTSRAPMAGGRRARNFQGRTTGPSQPGGKPFWRSVSGTLIGFRVTLLSATRPLVT